ncbi:MAG TPA: flagellar cap protein FliD N-terminal domain-containing protein, partial [Polyangiaceae bacterium]|nr:flagellar cap protein FliD N-terminal domain-containing protein [Polyangiaceae bacterium]
MANISFGGIASGLDTGSIITALVNEAKQPMDLLTQQQSDYKSQSTKLTNINTKLTALQDAAKALDTKNEALGNTVTSSDTSVLSATAT